MDIELQTFVFADRTVQLYVPNIPAIKQWYHLQKINEVSTPFPYWAKVWPSAIALCTFLVQRPQFIEQKNVLEVAAGLGLPSLLAAKYATNVICTDYVQEPLDMVQQSIEANALQNISCSIFNWNHLPQKIDTDVVLLSDINYEPVAFDALHNMIDFFLQKQKTILIATPQRLMAKLFVEKLEPYTQRQETIDVDGTPITILVLHN